MEIFGHRGAAGTFPENTMISFQEAARVGANGIELDVHMSKDDELIVIHDETVDRTSNAKGFVRDLTYDQIRKMDASYKFKKKYGVCPIPTLNEVLEWAAELPLKVNIELKNNVFEYPYLEMKVIDLIYKLNMKENVILSSFNHNSIMRVLSLDSTIETAILYSWQMFEPWNYAKHLSVKGLHPNYRTLNDIVVQAARSEQLAVRPYTVNDAEVMKKMRDLGCDAVITDYPERGVKLLKSH
ncbi:glycerophosphodiester phosphodiesterase [Bacillus songklensis]|uniref:Glycerophosphodiester phosphodiesterase n=1 Tax=Bacillus songklensis TaxID=1069116 RepID=A0ABV8B0V6_9BACI